MANYFKSDINKFIPHEVQIVISIKNLYHKITLPTIVSMGYININIRREWVIGSEDHVLPLNFVYLECQCDNCKRFFDKLSKLSAVSVRHLTFLISIARLEKYSRNKRDHRHMYKEYKV